MGFGTDTTSDTIRSRFQYPSMPKAGKATGTGKAKGKPAKSPARPPKKKGK